MAHTFKVALGEEISSVLKRVESAITGNGGTFQGDAEKGSFHGNSVMGPIRGEYCSLAGNEIRITITGKPFIVPYGMIESEIKKYFS
jgi:hypothetical protein